MADDGLQDMIGIMNVTLKGMEISMSATKDTLKVIARMCQLLMELANAIKDLPYKKSGGKMSTQVLGTLFQNLSYNEFKFSDIGERLYNEYGDNNYNQQKAMKLLNYKVLEKKFEELAKKANLPYARVPNFVKNPDTGHVEYRIAFPTSKLEAYNEVTKQLSAYIDASLVACGINNENVRRKVTSDTISESRPIESAVNEIGIANITNEQYEVAMRETYPTYVPVVPQEPSDATKSAVMRFARSNEYTRHQSRDNAVEITFSHILKRDTETQTITVLMEQYPNAVITIKKPDILDYHESFIDQSTKQYHVMLRKDNVYKFIIFPINPDTEKMDTRKPEHLEMSFNEFERLMSQERTKQKTEKPQLSETKQVPVIKSTLSR